MHLAGKISFLLLFFHFNLIAQLSELKGVVRDANGESILWLWAIGSETARETPGTRVASGWSPDSQAPERPLDPSTSRGIAW